MILEIYIFFTFVSIVYFFVLSFDSILNIVILEEQDLFRLGQSGITIKYYIKSLIRAPI